ncbi:MAG: BolA family transcriptional regulator [alpha proteobacterium HIMB59]|jgi:stress-induced morphogen|nr:MAG: BolA family transcriptional regulator [alpha proteobacterium HIMB59]|tara:strand:+ start:158 stop:391 length:234 start_codon:yes stop_codon:yes gene_type:complete
MPIEQFKLEELIKNKFPNANILVEDLAGDNNHYSVSIESSAFNGLSRIQQHQLVYKSLDGLMDNELHAMQLKTKGTK